MRRNFTPANVIKAFRKMANALEELQFEAGEIQMEASDLSLDDEQEDAMTAIEAACDVIKEKVDEAIHDTGGIDACMAAIARSQGKKRKGKRRG